MASPPPREPIRMSRQLILGYTLDTEKVRAAYDDGF